MKDRIEARPERKLRDRIEEIFRLDLRSLALFRISIAALLFGDIAFRLPHLVPLYAERGLLPAEAALEVIGPGLYFSLHFLLRGSVAALAGLFALQLVVALAMLVGFRTRIATAMSWYLLASLQVAENYHFHLGGDTYLRMWLLWGTLLPLGRVWSLDALRQSARSSAPQEGPSSTVSWVTVAVVSQFMVFYLAAGLCKDTAIWTEGSAVYYILHRAHLATPFTTMLLEQRWALAPLTHGTRWLEVLGPLLFVLPFYNSLARMVGIALFTVFHLGLGMFINIGPYPLMSIIPLSVLLPTRFWQEWWPRFRGRVPASHSAAGRSPRPLGAPVAVQVFAGLVVAYSLVYQLHDFGVVRLPGTVVAGAGALRLNQNYQMMRNIGPRNFWLIVEGHTADGSQIDPFRQAPLANEKPDDIPATLRSFRWRQFILGSISDVAEGRREQILHHAFAEYVCREWNADHHGAAELEWLKTIRGFETTHLDRVTGPDYAVLWQHECGAPLERDAASM